MSSQANDQGVFINGRQQVIELLRHMDDSDKQTLINNIKSKNSYLARELSEESLSFKSIENLSTSNIAWLLRHFDPAIIGLALYPMPVNFQRKILSSIERTFAEKAFAIMNQDLSQKQNQCVRAQEKILNLVISMSRQGKLNF